MNKIVFEITDPQERTRGLKAIWEASLEVPQMPIEVVIDEEVIAVMKNGYVIELDGVTINNSWLKKYEARRDS